MSLRDVQLKRAYFSDSDDILHDFYIPALGESTEYMRIAGFFSSSSLAVAARGISGLIKNSGSMKIVVSSRLSQKDLTILKESQETPEAFTGERFIGELDNLEDEFVRDHVRALGWMVANNKLDIKIAILQDEAGNPISYEQAEIMGIFHPKVGILRDSNGNTLSFSGSVNESALGWWSNIEEFKVFRSWELVEPEYIQTDIQKFSTFWNAEAKRARVVDLPEAVREQLIDIAPEDISQVDLHRHYGRIGQITSTRKVELFNHQKQAIDKWVKNNMQCIFEMATGTGKTFAALGCVDLVFKKYEKLITVIACPRQHLVRQWEGEIKKYGLKGYEQIIADSSNPLWKKYLADMLIDIEIGHKKKLIILTTHNTFASEDFQNIMTKNKATTQAFLIVDEVHGIGSEKQRQSLKSFYELRLGLSATPRRWFDDIGTKHIYDYFNITKNDDVFEFGLKEAVSTINPATGETYLAPYDYVLKFITLSAEEMNEYVQNSNSISKLYFQSRNDEEKEKSYYNLIFRRAEIVKKACGKYKILEDILDDIGQSIELAIIYCIPKQIDKVMEIVNKRNIVSHRFTDKQGTDPKQKFGGITEREYILKNFAVRKYKVLVAMKCLDEGVDIPPARITILMASSGNPREHIQRIGRVIRRYPGKTKAIVYDVAALPSVSALSKELKEIELKILRAEFLRCEEIAQIADNNAEALKNIYDVKKKIFSGLKE